MLIRFKCYVSGPLYTYKTGQVVDHPVEKEALRWIELGIADPEQQIERAVSVAPERAVMPGIRRHRRGVRAN